MKVLPVMPAMCATCPFRPGSQYAYLADDLAKSAMSEASRICHSTGTSAIYGRTGKPERICRGARDIQLKVMTAMGAIKAPTDAAWTEAVERLKAAKKPGKK
jgi:hypothetical protein